MTHFYVAPRHKSTNAQFCTNVSTVYAYKVQFKLRSSNEVPTNASIVPNYLEQNTSYEIIPNLILVATEYKF